MKLYKLKIHKKNFSYFQNDIFFFNKNHLVYRNSEKVSWGNRTREKDKKAHTKLAVASPKKE